MRIDVLTIFPEMLYPVLNHSILRIAQQKGLVEILVHNIRDWAHGKRRNVDDRPYGGGPGMIMKPEPIFRAVEAVRLQGTSPGRVILLSPQGQTLRQTLVRQLAAEGRLILVCGRYEGFDERIRAGLGAEEISIGDYVLSGGEIPALVLIDALTRLVPGVLGHDRSAAEDSFESGLLDFPQYTRPPEFRGMRVPEVLLTGNHEAIRKWREQEAKRRTRERRSDLLGESA